jgi:hypothetical protein
MEDITTSVIVSDDGLLIDVLIGFHTDICFRVKNIISSLMEANTVCWIMKSKTEHQQRIPFYVKIHSDSNKEQWARILGKAFDSKEQGIFYPWTVVVAKVAGEIENQIRLIQQDFPAHEIVGKQAEWLLEPFVQQDQINTLFGMGSSGKTLMSLYFGKIISKERGTNVLFIDYEDTAGGWRDKLGKIENISSMGTDLSKFVYYASEQIPIAEQVDKIKEVIKKREIGLVIVDSASLATGESTSDEKAAVRLVSALKLLRTTVLLVAHQRKNDGDRTPIGSIQYENQSRNVWNVKGSPDEMSNSVIHVAMTHTKANNTYLRRQPFGFRIEYSENSINITIESAQSYFSDKYTVIQRIEQLLKDEGEFDYKGISESLGITPASANRHLTMGKKRGMFENKNGRWLIKQEENEDPTNP